MDCGDRDLLENEPVAGRVNAHEPPLGGNASVGSCAGVAAAHAAQLQFPPGETAETRPGELDRNPISEGPAETQARPPPTKEVPVDKSLTSQSSPSSATGWEWLADLSRQCESGVVSASFVSSDRSCNDAQQHPTPLPSEEPSSSMPRDSAELISNAATLGEATTTEVSVASTGLASGRSESLKTMSTSHSSATEWRCNRSGGDKSPPSSVKATSASPPLPPQDVVATWERAIAATLAVASYSSLSSVQTLSPHTGLKASIGVTDPPPPPPVTATPRLSHIMCRNVDAVLIQPQQPLSTIQAAIEGDRPVAERHHGLFDKPRSYMSSAPSTATNDDPDSDIEQGPEGFQDDSESWNFRCKAKRRNRIRRAGVFLVIVVAVLGITIVGIVVAMQGRPSSKNSAAADTTASTCHAVRQPPSASSLPSVLTRDLGKDEINGTSAGGGDHYLLSSDEREGSFGEFVAVSGDGNFLAVTELLSDGAWMVHLLSPAKTAGVAAPSAALIVHAPVTSMVLNRDGTVLAVGLASGVAEVYEQDALCKVQWNQLGKAILPDRDASRRASELSPTDSIAPLSTSVSLSDDGRDLAIGLITSTDIALYQVLRFQNGSWKRTGPAIEYDDDGSFTHTAAKVSLSSSSTCGDERAEAGQMSCVLAFSRMFEYEQYSFGMISVRNMSADGTSWDAVGQTIPFALRDASLSLSGDGLTLAVSDAGSTTVYSLHRNETSSADDEWLALGQEGLPPASSLALAGSGWRLALATNQQVTVFELDPRDVSSSSNGTTGPSSAWKTIREVTVVDEAAGNRTDVVAGPYPVRVALSDDGRRLIVGSPNDPRSGRTMVVSL